jgi:hypothetical protein
MNVIDETPGDFVIIDSVDSVVCVNDATASWNGESDAESSRIDHPNGKFATQVWITNGIGIFTLSNTKKKR